MKLIVKVLILVGTIAIVSSLLGGFLMFEQIKGALEKAIGENRQIVATEGLAKIDRLLFERYVDMQMIAQDSVIEDLGDFKNSSMSSELLEAAKFGLDKYSLNTGPWDELEVVDMTGKVLVSTTTDEVGEVILSDVNYKNAFENTKGRGVYYSDVFLVNDKPTMIFSAPIYNTRNPGNPQVGMVIGKFSWQVVVELLEEMGGEWHLYNKEGVLIASSTKEDASEYLIQSDADSAVLKQGLCGKSGVMIGQGLHRSGQSLVVYVPQKGYLKYKGNGWVITSEMESALVFAPARESALKLTLMLSAVVGGISMIGLLLFIKLVIAPVGRLSNAVLELALGKWNHRVKVESNDEIGLLAKNVNKMAEAIQKAMSSAELERDKLATVVESIGDAVFVLDNQMKIVMVNRVTEELSGFNRQELVGQLYREKLVFRLEKNNQENTEFVDLVYKKGMIVEMSNHTVLIKKDGSRVAVSDSAAPLKDEKNKVTGCVVVFRDVSQERKVERMKDEFVSLASHQLRTPLTALRWTAKKLLTKYRRGLSFEQIKTAETFYESSVHLAQLVNDLLSISRIESGALTVSSAKGQISKVVVSVVEELQTLWEAKGLKVRVDEQFTGETVFDEELVRQVLVNLLSNAIKYSQKESEVLLCVKEEKIDNSDSVKILVSDHGIGIPLEKQSSIFERFFRAQNAVDSQAEGTGLGLHLVKMITEAMGGKVGFESKEGEGSTFWFWIPKQGLSSSADIGSNK